MGWYFLFFQFVDFFFFFFFLVFLLPVPIFLKTVMKKLKKIYFEVIQNSYLLWESISFTFLFYLIVIHLFFRHLYKCNI